MGTYEPSYASHAVKTARDVQVSGDNGGATPMKLTCRWSESQALRGVVVFSHGLGGSGDYYELLSEFWAAHGYLVIHPIFPDWIGSIAAAEPQLGLDPQSDDLLKWTANPDARAHMHKILHSPQWWLKRLHILQAVLDNVDHIIEATVGIQDDPVPIAVAGHSFGAYVSQLLAGAQIDISDLGVRSFRDKRVSAAILLSAQGAEQQGLHEGSWDNVTVPMLTITGTLDRGAGGQDWKWKSQPFYCAPAGGKYLVVLDEADHYLGGFDRVPIAKDVPAQRDAICQLTLAFLDAILCTDETALDWLRAISDQIGEVPVLFDRK